MNDRPAGPASHQLHRRLAVVRPPTRASLLKAPQGSSAARIQARFCPWPMGLAACGPRKDQGNPRFRTPAPGHNR